MEGRCLSKQKKKQKKTDKINHIKRDIFAVVLLSTCVLIFFSVVFEPGTVGVAGDLIRKIFLGLFGKFASFLIPITLLVYSFLILINKFETRSKKIFLKLILLYIFFSALINISIYSKYDFASQDFFGRIEKYYQLGTDGIGGGALGSIMSVPLVEYLKILGSVIVIATLAVVNLIIITGVSISEGFSKLFSMITKLFNMKKPKKSKHKIIVDKVKLIKKSKSKGTVKREAFNFDELEVEKEPEKKISKISKKEKLEIEDKTLEIKKPGLANNKGQPQERKIIYSKPPLYLLKGSSRDKITTSDLRKSALERADILIETLKSFNVEAEIINISIGPNVTQYELSPSRGVKVSKIVNLADDIALNLAAADVRIEAPIPGKAAIGIEVPNEKVNTVHLKDIIESKEFMINDSKLTFALGKDISGLPITSDICRMPHLLIAGATGSGKSVCINNLILSLLFNSSPEEVKLILIDPKVVELKVYDGIPHLLIPVVTDPRKAAGALLWGVSEMNRRYSIFADNSVKDFKTYNRSVGKSQINNEEEQRQKLPYIVIIIDELADLMFVAPNEVEDSICRLAQMARAAGIHLVLATQRPSVNVITGLIKANIPSRISFAVSAQVDSRTILDMGGAEKLLGKGDMLYLPIGTQKPKRLQGAFVSDKEVETVVDYLKSYKKVEYDDDVFEVIDKGNYKDSFRKSKTDDIDVLLSEAIKVVVETGNASASLLQRKLKVGYARAGRLVDQMAERNIVGPYAGSKPREVLISKEEFYEMELKQRKYEDE